MKRLPAFLAAVVFLMVSTGLAANAAEPQVDGEFDWDKHLIVEMWEAPREQQSLGFREYIAGPKKDNNYFCTDLVEQGCIDAMSDKNQMFRLQVILPTCEGDSDSNCIENVSIYESGTQPIPAKFDRVVQGNSWDAIPARNIPEGSTTSLWNQPETPNAAGIGSYAVAVKLDLGVGSGGKVNISGFEAQVIPFRLDENPEYRPHQCFQAPYEARGNIDNVSCGGIREHCAWSETGVCGEIVNFASDTRVNLVLRLSNTIGGWFSGRIKDPNISVVSKSSSQNQVIVDAAAVDVPTLKAGTDTTKASEKIKKIFANCPEYQSYGRCWTAMDTRSQRSVEIVDAYREVVKDSATYMRNPWLIRAETTRGNNACLSSNNRVLGIVATNAMIYQSGIPTFSGGSLKYWVAGMHFLPDKKTEALGTYDLVMRSDVARCLYGFSNAPVEAAVTITGSGDTNVATKVVGESNGWLKLAAYGFTFSTKTIGIKLIGQKVKKTSISCVTVKKPTKSKTISGVNPKCPAGYKKK